MRYADNSIKSNPGSPVRQLYAPKVASNGSIELVEAGIEDSEAYINSFKDSTDIRVILARVAAGETELLNQRKGVFGDFTSMPSSYAEFLQLQIDSNRLFNSLPTEVRQQFGNDPNQFFAQAGTDEWMQKLNPILPDEMRSMNNPPDASVDPVKPSEPVSE